MDRWIKNNNVAKILALAISVLLWAMVHKGDVSTKPQMTTLDTRIIDNVKVQTYGLDTKKYVLNSINPERVRIEVRGKRSDITSFFAGDYKVMVDLSGIKPGTHTIPLSYELPSGVEMVSMDPSMVTVDLEELKTKEFDVNIETTGTPAEGYQVGVPIIKPSNKVKVTLPENLIDDVKSVKGVIDVDGADSSIKDKKVKLAAYDKEGKEIPEAEISPSTVQVDLSLAAPYITVPLELKYTGQLPEGLNLASVKTSVNQVALFGPKEALKGMESYKGVTINLSDVKGAGNTELNVDLTPPPGFEKIEPSSVKVELSVVPEAQRVIDDIPIIIQGSRDEWNTTIVSPQNGRMSLTLAGASNLLDALKPEDIQLTVNVSNLKPGTHQVPVHITLPQFIKLVNQADNLIARVEIAEKDKATNGTGTTGDKNGSSSNPNGDPGSPVNSPGNDPGSSDPASEVSGSVNGQDTNSGSSSP
ncbi:CdaR family protein [Paenibacillus sediminis]|uniref:YbbR domain-containing protein n=1 Tax=Paenibacillus sediminis TaxID=664909 RepID=A0ABS4H463_9BACL|nr:CdaR family protein [Paenibacillus sediminis]MBP1937325.1 YbbR domain-containing protein [Paenibacillus sediminis]